MRLPGTRYQEHGWERVRKLLGHCSLQALAHGEAALPGLGLGAYVDAMADLLHAAARSERGAAPGNSYGDSVHELALSLIYELQARPADWAAFGAALTGEHVRLGAFWEAPGGEALLRKKINDLFAGVRDKVDSDNYQVACGRSCSPNKMYAYRMLDTAYHEVARIFSAWHTHPAQVAAILGRAVDAQPIEVRQMKSIGQCKAEWIMRWSETLEQFGGAPGPLHTRSKRFASLKTSLEKIGAMLREIGDYEELSSNRDQDWLQDLDQAENWLDDLWRVLDEGASTAQLDEVGEQAGQADQADLAEVAETAAAPLCDSALAASVSLPPRFIELVWQSQGRGSWAARMLAQESLPVRLAVYLKMLGACDDSYPADWLDPASGELPTMQQLAVLDQVSLPTLRKRRDGAIARLLAAPA